jgi:hypothetical protein
LSIANWAWWIVDVGRHGAAADAVEQAGADRQAGQPGSAEAGRQRGGVEQRVAVVVETREIERIADRAAVPEGAGQEQLAVREVRQAAERCDETEIEAAQGELGAVVFRDRHAAVVQAQVGMARVVGRTAAQPAAGRVHAVEEQAHGAARAAMVVDRLECVTGLAERVAVAVDGIGAQGFEVHHGGHGGCRRQQRKCCGNAKDQLIQPGSGTGNARSGIGCHVSRLEVEPPMDDGAFVFFYQLHDFSL